MIQDLFDAADALFPNCSSYKLLVEKEGSRRFIARLSAYGGREGREVISGAYDTNGDAALNGLRRAVGVRLQERRRELERVVVIEAAFNPPSTQEEL